MKLSEIRGSGPNPELFGVPATVVIDSKDAINVQNFGAKGDGQTNDTAAIQAAVDVAVAGSGKVLVPDGVYMVDALQAVRLRSGVVFQMESGAILQAIPNSSRFSAVLAIENVNNVTVLGGTIRGERKLHSGKKGEWGMGVQINGSRNILIQGTAANDCWGDGFYIGTETFVGPNAWMELFGVPENIRLIDIRANNNRRQGISLIAGINVEILRPILTNTNGTAPAAGLDIETNRNTDFLENIVVSDAFTANNQGSGITLNTERLQGTDRPISIKIINHRDEGSNRGFFTGGRGIIPGSILIDSPQWIESKQNALAILIHDYRSFFIDVCNPQIYNANRKGSKVPTTGATIAVYNFDGDEEGDGIGNIRISAPFITETEDPRKTVRGIYAWDVSGRPLQNFIITAPAYLAQIGFDESLKQYIKSSQP